MTGLLIILCLALIAIVVVQIGRVAELAARVRGEAEVQKETNEWNARLSLLFLVVFLVGCVVSAIYYKNWMLGYGPHESASAHGGQLDYLFNITLFFTGIVFVICHIALFWFAYKYRADENRKALFIPHDNKLEIVWTAIPAVVMTFLVVSGLAAWNDVMADIGEGEEHIEIEAMGMQFAWLLRYPGSDGKLGSRNYKLTTGLNPLGQDWSDTKNLDDIHPTEIVLPVNKKVRVRILARDVLHNFDLPHFRVKMDAIPGLPTYFVFTPTKTTEEYRQELRKYPEYHAPYDVEDLESPALWEAFNYELACAELCGKGHFSMRRVVRIVSEEEYEDWLSQQQSYYMQSIRNSDDDPHKGKLLPIEIKQRAKDFSATVKKAVESEKEEDKVIRLEYVTFRTGSAQLTDNSRYELENLSKALNDYPNMVVEVAGHTDSTGDADANLALSDARARSVKVFLHAKGIAARRMQAVGYGDTVPRASNDTEEGRQQNRRTEFKILSQ